MKLHKKYRQRVPRKLKKAAKKFTIEVFPEFPQVQIDGNRAKIVQYRKYVFNGRETKWSRKCISRYRKEQKNAIAKIVEDSIYSMEYVKQFSNNLPDSERFNIKTKGSD